MPNGIAKRVVNLRGDSVIKRLFEDMMELET